MDLGPTLHKKGTVNKNRIHLSVLPGCGQDPYSSVCPSWLWMESLFIPLSFPAVGRAHINPSVLPGCGQHPYPSPVLLGCGQHPYPSLCASWLWRASVSIPMCCLAVDQTHINRSVFPSCGQGRYSSFCPSWLWMESVFIPLSFLTVNSICIHPLSSLAVDGIHIHPSVLPRGRQDQYSFLCSSCL